MKFDNTYITLFGYSVFEPMVVLTNLVFLILSIVFAKRLFGFASVYARQMALFILALGISMAWGATGHAVQLQAGQSFFDLILFLMNFFSMCSVFFCFRGCYFLLYTKEKKSVFATVLIILSAMLVYSFIRADFTTIKIMAGLVLLFALYVHQKDWRKNRREGSRTVNLGILISFLSLLSHTLHISLHEWFNHKDIAHVIMIIGMVFIYKGVYNNSADLSLTSEGQRV